MKFILFHGAFGSPESNWLPELKDKLESLGQEVIVPKFPVDEWSYIEKQGERGTSKNQTLEHWFTIFEPIVKSFAPNEKLCFVGHSLGPVFILHVVERFHIQLDSAIFVSPFMDKLDQWQINVANETFYKTNFDFEALKKLIPVSYVLYSDDDPYVPKQHSILFGKALDSSLILVKRAGHMNSEVNLNDFPLVLDLCISRLDLALYQRYLTLREKLGLVDYVRTRQGSSVKVDAQAALDEGVFRFRHLQKSGFYTLFTGLTTFWDPKSQYMKDARAASQKGKELTRVIIAKQLTDLQSASMFEQIKLDIEAGIAVYVCLYKDIQNDVEVPDFGITDDDYVCLVPYDEKTHTVKEIELNSTTEVMEKAKKWKEIIFKKATKITNPEKDIKKFIQSHQ